MNSDRDGHDEDRSGQLHFAAGQAALLLVESLIHELVDADVLPLERAIVVVEVAVDAAGEIALAKADGLVPDDGVGRLLQTIADTLSLDMGRQPPIAGG